MEVFKRHSEYFNNDCDAEETLHKTSWVTAFCCIMRLINGPFFVFYFFSVNSLTLIRKNKFIFRVQG